MAAKVIRIEEIPYRIFVNREPRGYRGFWFCPHPNCFGGFRSDHLSETREDALEVASEAAGAHECEIHTRKEDALSLESPCQAPALSKLFGQ
jgi:hypothetical protein